MPGVGSNAHLVGHINLGSLLISNINKLPYLFTRFKNLQKSGIQFKYRIDPKVLGRIEMCSNSNGMDLNSVKCSLVFYKKKLNAIPSVYYINDQLLE